MNNTGNNEMRFDFDILQAYTVPETPAGLEDRIIGTIRKQGLLSVGKRSGSRSFSWMAIAACAAALVAVVLVIVLVWPGGKGASEIKFEQISVRSTIRISDRVVALAESGAELGYRVEDDGSVTVEQRLGVVTYRVEGVGLQVQTPSGLVTVQGTCFRVSVNEGSDALAVAVHNGRVIVENSGEQLILNAGEHGRVQESSDVPRLTDGDPTGPCPIGDELFASSRIEGHSPESSKEKSQDKTKSTHKPGEPPDPFGDLVLEGQILDQEGLPAEGVLVTLGSRPERKTITGKDGTFSFDRMIPRSCWIHARRGNQIGGHSSHRLSASSDPVVIRMRKASRLRVEVRAADSGKPVPGARVTISGQEDRTTGLDGTALFEGVGGQESITVRKHGYVPQEDYVETPLISELPIAYKATLQRGPGLAGRVLDQNGQAVANASVKILPGMKVGSHAMRQSTTSDKQGRFSFDAVAEGTCKLAAQHDEHGPVVTGPVEVGTGRPVKGIEIVMAPGARIRGHVVDQNGDPVGFAQVRYSSPRKGPNSVDYLMGRLAWGHRYADESGRFEIGGLPKEEIGLSANTPISFSQDVFVDLEQNPDTSEIELVVEPGGRISGIVVDGEGKPQAEAMVLAMADFSETEIMHGFINTTADGAGRFEFTGLARGTYIVQASRFSDRINWRQVDVKARTGDEDVRLEITEYGSIKGRVHFGNGSIPDRFVIELGVSWQPGVPFETKDGRFEIEGIGPGRYEVTVKGEGFSVLNKNGITVKPGEVTDVGDLVVDRGRRISGRVVDGDGRQVADAKVIYGTSLDGDGSRIRVSGRFPTSEVSGISGPDGRFVLEGVGSDRGLVIADHERLGRSRAVVIPKGTQDSEAVLVVHETGSIRGQVRVNGKPEALGFVTVHPKDLQPVQQELQVSTDADGKYVIERVTSGELVMRARSRLDTGGSPRKRKVVVVKPGEQIVVDFDLKRSEISLGVNVRGKKGARVEHANIWLFRGRVEASTRGDIERLERDPSVVFHPYYFRCTPENPCVFKSVLPGEHTLCAFPYRSLENKEYLKLVHKHSANMPVICRSIQIAAEPKEQTLTLYLRATEPPAEQK